MAISVMRSASRMHDSSSGVLVAFAWLITRPPSAGALEANSVGSRRKAFVHSSMATAPPLGTSPARSAANSSTPSSKSR